MTPALALALALAQPTCRTALQRRVCGYHCVTDASAEVACANTEAGSCSAESGHAYCWDPSPILAAIWPGALPPSRCVALSDRVACGWHCLSDRPNVACAQTPAGICFDDQGSITCWDPPLALVHELHGDVPTPECRENGRRVACGYHCVSALGEVRCAQTPQGVCHSDLAGLHCWDPTLPPIVSP